MRVEKRLLLLTVCMMLDRCQPELQVTMSPRLNEIFSGDLLYLKCEGSNSGATVNWYKNQNSIGLSNETFKIAVARPTDSGTYHCEFNSKESKTYTITVLDFVPIATLTLKTGQPVMQKGASVILNLHHEGGIQDWTCWVYRGTSDKRIGLKKTNESSLDFQPKKLEVPETIFWCTHKTEDIRSNQIIVRTSDKPVSLEMYNLPAVVGESLSMRCLVWGTHKISETVFYKNNTILSLSSNVHQISNVTEAESGIYKCKAKYRYKDNTDGPEYQEVSDDQDLHVPVSPVLAVLSKDMSCSCERCTNVAEYHFYYMRSGSWVYSGNTKPTEAGIYTCRAVWKNKRSALSNTCIYKPPTSIVLLLVIFLLVFLLLAAVAYFVYRRRNNTLLLGRVYEDVPLRSREGDKGEPEYDTLNPEAPDKKTGGEYEPLKKEEMKEGVYHTLGAEGAAGGEGGYEALKKGEMKEGVYHTLGAEGAAGGEGGYEALKKGETKEGVYHTLGAEGAAGGEGGYEALKKGEMKEGVYHTLEVEGAAGGEGGKQTEGKENKDKEYELVVEKQEAKVE